MTLAANVPINGYVGNSGANTYAFTFPVFTQSQISVSVTSPSPDFTLYNLVIGTDYTVTGLNASGDPASTGSIVLVNSSQAWLTGGNLITGWALVIQINVPYAQTTSIRNQGDFYRSALEDALDYDVMQIQQLALALGRQLTLPPSILPSAFSPILPASLPANPGYAIVVNPSGNGFSLAAALGSIVVPISVGNGGTGSGAALNNNRVMQSSSGKIVEAAAITASKALASDVNGIPVATVTTAAELALIHVLTGLSPTLGAITSADSMLIALNKIINARIVQIVLATSTTQFTTTSSTFQLTNLTGLITPLSTTSKILVLTCASGQVPAGHNAYATLERNAVNLGGTLGFSQLSATTTTGINGSLSIAYLDSPASISALTYAVYLKNDDNAASVIHGFTNQTQVMILIEIGVGS